MTPQEITDHRSLAEAKLRAMREEERRTFAILSHATYPTPNTHVAKMGLLLEDEARADRRARADAFAGTYSHPSDRAAFYPPTTHVNGRASVRVYSS